MCEQKKESELYRKILTKNDLEYNVIEIAIVNYHINSELGESEVTIIEFKNGYRNNISIIDGNILDTGVKLDEITESDKWERITATALEIDSLEKCICCDGKTKCLDCNLWFARFKPPQNS